MDSDAKRVRGRKRASTFMLFFVCLFYFSNAYSTHLVFYHLRSWNSHLMKPQVGTPGNCCWGGGGGGCAARFSKFWPYFRTKLSFSTPVFRPGGGRKTQHYKFTSNRNYVIIATKIFLKIHFEFAYYTLFSCCENLLCFHANCLPRFCVKTMWYITHGICCLNPFSPKSTKVISMKFLQIISLL